MIPIEISKRPAEERLAELIRRIPEGQRELVAAHLIGTIQGILIAQEMAKTPA